MRGIYSEPQGRTNWGPTVNFRKRGRACHTSLPITGYLLERATHGNHTEVTLPTCEVMIYMGQEVDIGNYENMQFKSVVSSTPD